MPDEIALSGGEHGGFFNAAMKDFSFSCSDFTLKNDQSLKIGRINNFAIAISSPTIQSSHMCLLIFNPPLTSPYGIEANFSVD